MCFLFPSLNSSLLAVSNIFNLVISKAMYVVKSTSASNLCGLRFWQLCVPLPSTRCHVVVFQPARVLHAKSLHKLARLAELIVMHAIQFSNQPRLLSLVSLLRCYSSLDSLHHVLDLLRHRAGLINAFSFTSHAYLRMHVVL